MELTPFMDLPSPIQKEFFKVPLPVDEFIPSILDKPGTYGAGLVIFQSDH